MMSTITGGPGEKIQKRLPVASVERNVIAELVRARSAYSVSGSQTRVGFRPLNG